ncbi:MAG: hypothetical protein ABEN55_21145 [Bradymonadaceae bacterium]
MREKISTVTLILTVAIPSLVLVASLGWQASSPKQAAPPPESLSKPGYPTRIQEHTQEVRDQLETLARRFQVSYETMASDQWRRKTLEINRRFSATVRAARVLEAPPPLREADRLYDEAMDDYLEYAKTMERALVDLHTREVSHLFEEAGQHVREANRRLEDAAQHVRQHHE